MNSHLISFASSEPKSNKAGTIAVCCDARTARAPDCWGF